jgi:hypothetical protein
MRRSFGARVTVSSRKAAASEVGGFCFPPGASCAICSGKRLEARFAAEGEKSVREIGHFIGGKQVTGGSGRRGDLFNPTTGEVQEDEGREHRRRACHPISCATIGVYRFLCEISRSPDATSPATM